jgi:hypothetical protein
MGRRAAVQKKPMYATEAELCDEFSAIARAHGFFVYPETSDFDLLLVAGPRCKGFQEGDQVGIQAKLRANINVLYQALPRSIRASAPHYYAVLVPSAHLDVIFREIASRLKISVISDLRHEYRKFDFARLALWRHEPIQTCWTPDCEVESMQGGKPAPVQLTKWKQAALKLCAIAQERGFVTKRDFARLGVSMQRWVTARWVVGLEDVTVVYGGKRMKAYALAECADAPHLRYGNVLEAMKKAGVA